MWMCWPQVNAIATIKDSSAGSTNKADIYVTPNRVKWLNEHILVVSFTNGEIKLYDVAAETTIQTLKTYSHLDKHTISKERDLINDICVQEQFKVIAAAYEDHYARIFDVNSNKLVSSIVAHPAPATCISIARDGLTFATGSSANSIRLWSLDTKKCVQEISNAHHTRLDESVCAIKFHPKMSRYLGSSGADGIVKMYMN